MKPVVSVVLIVYDDRDRLGRALTSALAQQGPPLEVVVVDDGSTDGTASVAAEWAARDARVRVVTRATNSGGCGAPRNDGLDAATGQYVMFLDSDDELEPGAVAGLVTAAERSGADVVLGRARRFNEDVGTSVPWRPGGLDPVDLTTTAQLPAVAADTLVVDKLYRREFLSGAGVRFPTDIHYEDLVFTAQVYAACTRLCVTDVPVYVWYVRERSITNSRAELRSITDRVEATRRADDVLAAAGRDDLRAVRDRRFVDNDLELYLRELPDLDLAFGRAFVEVVAPYTRTLRPEATRGQPAALVLALLAAGDVVSLQQAAALAYRGRVARPLTRDGTRWRWPGVPGPAGDVTAIVERLTRRGLHLEHEVTALHADAAGLRADVVTTDPLGLLGDRGSVRLLVLARARGRSTSLRIARARAVKGAGGLGWHVRLPLRAGLRAAAVPGELQLRVLARSGRRMSLGPLFVEPDTVAGTVVEGEGVAARAFRHAGGHLGVTRTG